MNFKKRPSSLDELSNLFEFRAPQASFSLGMTDDADAIVDALKDFKLPNTMKEMPIALAKINLALFISLHRGNDAPDKIYFCIKLSDPKGNALILGLDYPDGAGADNFDLISTIENKLQTFLLDLLFSINDFHEIRNKLT